jgi:preprotein translocase subunit SecA
VLARGEHSTEVAEYEAARRAFEESETRCEEVRGPYEAAIREAQKNYEAKRQEYVKIVEEVREELEKAPEAYRQSFEASLVEYEKLCAEEKTKVVAAGGLHIIGTERHESRRIDNQLRGRSGRQGDPGSSRFYLSLEDDLMRIFGAERIQNIMDRLGMEEGVPIEHGLVTRAIENAQKKVEAHNFDIRKHLLEYDDVMNKQREVIYHQRKEVLKSENLKEEVLDIAAGLAEEIADRYADDENDPTEWAYQALSDALYHQFAFRLEIPQSEREGMTAERLREIVLEKVIGAYERKETQFGPEMLRQLEKIIMLQTIDMLWKDHLLNMDHLKEGVGLRGYGQKNPLQEYQKEGFEMFGEMVHRIQEDVGQKLFTIEMAREGAVQEMQVQQRPQRMVLSHGGPEEAAPRQETVKRDGMKAGRNDPCPCGSGKKYKRCHGKN